MNELTDSLDALVIRKRVHFDSDLLDQHERKRAIRRVGDSRDTFMESKLREKQRMYELFGTESDESSDDEGESEDQEHLDDLASKFGKIDIVSKN